MRNGITEYHEILLFLNFPSQKKGARFKGIPLAAEQIKQAYVLAWLLRA